MRRDEGLEGWRVENGGEFLVEIGHDGLVDLVGFDVLAEVIDAFEADAGIADDAAVKAEFGAGFDGGVNAVIGGEAHEDEGFQFFAAQMGFQVGFEKSGISGFFYDAFMVDRLGPREKSSSCGAFF